MTVNDLQTSTLSISGDVKDSDEKSHHAWVFCSQFNLTHSTKATRCWKGDRSHQMMGDSNKRQANVIL